MIQFVGQNDTVGLVVGLGLTAADLGLLRERCPLLADLQPLTGAAGKLVIVYGEDVADLCRMLVRCGAVGPDTEVVLPGPGVC